MRTEETSALRRQQSRDPGPPGPPPIPPGRLAKHASPRQPPSCFSSSDLDLGGLEDSGCPRGRTPVPETPDGIWDRDQFLLLFFMKQVRYERRTKASKPEDQLMKARMKDMKGCLETLLDLRDLQGGRFADLPPCS